MALYFVTGNTFEHKQEIRRAGAAWNKDAKRWELDVVEHGFKRTDGEIYRLRKLPGLRVIKAEESA